MEFFSQRYSVFGRLKQALSTALHNSFNWIKADQMIMLLYELQSGGNKLLGEKNECSRNQEVFLPSNLAALL